jgi:hypothetical protein
MIYIFIEFRKQFSLLALAATISLGILHSARANDPCLELIHDKNQAKDDEYLFDIKLDQDRNGRSFSCGPQIRASEARKALDLFRYGVLYEDKASICSIIQFPLVVRINKTRDSNEKPGIAKVNNYEEWALIRKNRFDKNLIALVACAHLGNVRIHSGRSPGFEIGNGTFWFQSFAGDKKVYLSAINLAPLSDERLIDSCVGINDAVNPSK